MSQLDIEKIKKQLINGRDIRDFKQYFSNDEFALSIIEFDRKYFKYFEKYSNNKEMIKHYLQKDKNYNTISEMGSKLREDLEFAEEIFAIDKSAIFFFDEKIKNSETMLNQYLKYIEATSIPIYTKELHKLKNEEFLELIDKCDLFTKLSQELKKDEKILLRYINSKHLDGDKIYFSTLPENIKNDFNINVKILNKTKSESVRSLLTKYIVSEIHKNKENLEVFLKTYSGIYDTILMKGLCQIKSFKHKYGKLIKEYPEQKDFKDYMRKIDLENILSEQQLNEKVNRNKKKI